MGLLEEMATRGRVGAWPDSRDGVWRETITLWKADFDCIDVHVRQLEADRARAAKITDAVERWVETRGELRRANKALRRWPTSKKYDGSNAPIVRVAEAQTAYEKAVIELEQAYAELAEEEQT